MKTQPLGEAADGYASRSTRMHTFASDDMSQKPFLAEGPDGPD